MFKIIFNSEKPRLNETQSIMRIINKHICTSLSNMLGNKAWSYGSVACVTVTPVNVLWYVSHIQVNF